MIARLQGTLEEKTASVVVIMAGGVGYEAHVPLSTFYELPDPGQDVELYIKTVVRDDAIELFGFMTRAEKEAFILLNTVSKVGPRLALNILSGIAPPELVSAVGQKNVARLSSVPGVGAKTAERLVVELKDKISALAALAGTAPSDISEPEPLDDTGQDVVSALLNLGYSRNEAQKAVSRVMALPDADNADLSALIRLSLKQLRKD
jgi:Holliday junction DNA helicase RuvA